MNTVVDPRWLTHNVVEMAKAVIEGPWDESLLPILADALTDAGCDAPFLNSFRSGDFELDRYSPYHRGLLLKLIGAEIPPVLDTYDWREAFVYAGDREASDGSANLHEAIPGSGVSLAPFSRWDIRTLLSFDEGENDGKNWLCVGELNDGRWFALDAGCDYTGWD